MVLLCPGSAQSQIFKRWPVQKFVQLGAQLQKFDLTVDILLGKEEDDLIPFFDLFTIHRDLSLSEIVDLKAEIDLSICNDSFLMHFFSLFSIQTLAIYGPTDPNRTLPPHVHMIQSPLSSDTRPCWGTVNYGKCDGDRCNCLDGLEVDNLISKVVKILN